MAPWTLEELVARAAGALAAAAVRAPNARVTEVPDARVIRWYMTIGLVDRPTAMRGRTALYGQRHLLQLVAIKRRQAEGRTLAEIQHELAGATDAALRRVAALTPELRIGSDPTPDAGVLAGDRQAPPAPRPATDRFWARSPGAAPRVAAISDGGSPTGIPPGAPATVAPRDQASLPREEPSLGTLHGVRLAAGAVLLLPAAPSEADLAVIEAAAGPLVAVLADRGLLAAPATKPVPESSTSQAP